MHRVPTAFAGGGMLELILRPQIKANCSSICVPQNVALLTCPGHVCRSELVPPICRARFELAVGAKDQQAVLSERSNRILRSFDDFLRGEQLDRKVRALDATPVLLKLVEKIINFPLARRTAIDYV